MPQSIADLFVTVSSDVSGALSGLSNVDNALGRTTTSMQAAAPAGLALAGAATAIGAGFLSSVNAASDFEHQINGIKAVMSPAEVLTFGAAVEDLAIKLGKDTVFSSSQAAAGIEELIKAGVPLPDILHGAAAAALDLASATGVPVAQAATFAATAMNTFHLAAADLPGIMDTISNVSNATATDVSGLQLAFAQIGPVAAGLGFSFGDTATALGIFANNGLKGSDAGTSLKTMMLNLEPTTKAQTAAFQALNLVNEDGSSKFFDATGKAKSMSDVFQVLKDSTAGLTDEQKVNLLQTAFGTDAVRAATIAAAEGAAGWENVTGSMEKMGGVQVAAAQRNQGLAGSMNQLGGSFEAVQITIGNLFLPALTSLAQGATAILNAFLGLDPTLQTFIVAAVGIAGAVAGVVAGIVLLTPAISATAVAFGVLTAAASPFLVPIIAITAAVAALYLAWQTDFGGIQEVTAEVWTAIQPAFANIQQFLGELGGQAGSAFGVFREAVSPVLDALNGFVTGALAGLPGWVREVGDRWNAVGVALQPLGPVLEMIGQAINFLVTGNLDRLIELMQEGIPQPFVAGLQLLRDIITVQIQVWGDLLGGIRDFVGYLLAGDFQGAFNSILSTFGKIKDDILPLWNEFLTVLGNLLSQLPGFLGNAAQGMWQLVLGVWSSLPGLVGPVWESIKTSLGGLMSQLPGALVAAAGAIWQYLIGVFSTLPGLAQPVWETIKQNLGGLMSQLPGALVTAAGAIWEYLVGVFSTLPGLVSEIWPTILSNIGGLLSQLPGALVTAAGDIWQYLVGVFSTLPGLVQGIWPDIVSNIGGLLSQLPGALVTAAGDIWQYLVGVFSTLPGLVQGIWPTILENLGGLLSLLPGSLVTAAGDIWQYLVGVFSTLPGRFAEIWPGIIEGLGGLMSTLGAVLATAAGDVWGWLVTATENVVTKIGEILGGVGQKIKDIFAGIETVVTGGGGTGTGGGGGGGFDGGGALPGSSAPLIYIATVNVTTEAERLAFFEQMSNYIAESTGRVSATITASLPSGA